VDIWTPELYDQTFPTPNLSSSYNANFFSLGTVHSLISTAEQVLAIAFTLAKSFTDRNA
jgi:hypothetical protein